VEWGGDIHCPPGDLTRAARVERLCRDAGLVTTAYGSYYRVGDPPPEGQDWEAVCETALALGAPVIRVWAGRQGSDDPKSAEDYWKRVRAEAARLVQSATERQLRIAFEYHGGTLCDTLESAEKLLGEDLDSMPWMYWQPRHGATVAQGLVELRSFARRLAHVHVFHWIGGWGDKRSLDMGSDRWPLYLRAAASAPALTRPDGSSLQRWAMLEFIPEDSSAGLLRDAMTLRSWLKPATATESRS
jgi:hypothetical protein